jgi:hypothetical protein
MKTLISAAGLVLVTAATTGCLAKETTHTIHLSPEGTVNWVVIEREVRSTESAPGDQAQEDADYLSAALAGQPAVARAFDILRPSAMRTTVYRDTRPFLVLTEAEFDRIDWLAARALEQLNLPGSSVLETIGDERRWTLTVDVSAVGDDADGESDENENVLGTLAEDADAYRIVLTSGQFTDAVGFRLEDGGTAAAPVEGDTSEPEPEVLRLSLTWRPDARR